MATRSLPSTRARLAVTLSRAKLKRSATANRNPATGKPNAKAAKGKRWPAPHPRSADFPVCGLWGLSSPHAQLTELESSVNPQTGKSALQDEAPDRGRHSRQVERGS